MSLSCANKSTLYTISLIKIHVVKYSYYIHWLLTIMMNYFYMQATERPTILWKRKKLTQLKYALLIQIMLIIISILHVHTYRDDSWPCIWWCYICMYAIPGHSFNPYCLKAVGSPSKYRATLGTHPSLA